MADDFSSEYESWMQGAVPVTKKGVAKDKKPLSSGETAYGLAALAANSALFGFGDEALSAVQSGLGYGDYESNLAANRQTLSRVEEDSPYLSMAANVGGGLIGGLGTGGILARGIPYLAREAGERVGTRILKTGLEGGIQGGIGGFGESEGGFGNRVFGSAQGAVGGAIAAPVVSEGLRAGAKVGGKLISNKQPRSLQDITQDPNQQSILQDYLYNEVTDPARIASARAAEERFKARGIQPTLGETFENPALQAEQNYLEQNVTPISGKVAEANRQRIAAIEKALEAERQSISPVASKDVAGRDIRAAAEKAEKDYRGQLVRKATPYYDKAKVEKTQYPEIYKGRINAEHTGELPNNVFTDPSQVDVSKRYGGGEGVWGNYTYLDENGRWSDGTHAYYPSGDKYNVEGNFNKAFVLTPKTYSTFLKVKDRNPGIHPSEALKKEGYDGVIVRDFDDYEKNILSSLEKQGKIENINGANYAKRGTFPIAEKEQDEMFKALVEKGATWNRENIGKLGIPEYDFKHADLLEKTGDQNSRRMGSDWQLLQDQVVSFKPQNNLKIVPEKGEKIQYLKPYEEIKQRIIPDNDPILNRPSIVDAIKEVKTTYKDELASLPDNSVAVLDAAKKVLDAKVQRAKVDPGGANDVRYFSNAANALRNTIDSHIPEYAKARAVYEEGAPEFERMAEERTYGLSRVKPETAPQIPGQLFNKTYTPQQIQDLTKRLGEEQLQKGAAGFIDETVEQTRDEAVGRIRGTLFGTPEKQEKFKTILGDKYDSFADLMDLSGRINTSRAAFANSKTDQKIRTMGRIAERAERNTELMGIDAAQGNKTRFLGRYLYGAFGMKPQFEGKQQKEYAEALYDFIFNPDTREQAYKMLEDLGKVRMSQESFEKQMRSISKAAAQMSSALAARKLSRDKGTTSRGEQQIQRMNQPDTFSPDDKGFEDYFGVPRQPLQLDIYPKE